MKIKDLILVVKGEMTFVSETHGELHWNGLIECWDTDDFCIYLTNDELAELSVTDVKADNNDIVVTLDI